MTCSLLLLTVALATQEAPPTDVWAEPVATVNDQPISRRQLAEVLMRTYGEGYLEGMIERRLIETTCKAAGVSVRPEEVEAELEKQLAADRMTRAEFERRALARKGYTSLAQYVREIVVPAVAMRKLVEGQVQVSETEMQRAFEANFGEKVDCRWLFVASEAQAQELWRQMQDVEGFDDRLAAFEQMCGEYNVHPSLQAKGGRADKPINRHTSADDVERLAFALQPGEVSPLHQVDETWLMLFCVERIPPVEDASPDAPVRPGSDETIADRLRYTLLKQKLQFTAGEKMRKIKEDTAIVRNLPEAGADPASAVATVGTESISWQQMAAEITEVYGVKQLRTMIRNLIVEQAVVAAGVDITKEQINEALKEQMRGLNLLKRDEFEAVLSGRGFVSIEHYLRDSFIPSLAAELLVAEETKVTAEQLDKAFEAQFGAKVQCRLLMVRNSRQASQLWQQVYDVEDPQERLKLFERLCKRHSIDETTRTRGGMLPAPIHRNYDPPLIEELAFALQPGELSRIADMGGGHLFLICEQILPATEGMSLDSPMPGRPQQTVGAVLAEILEEQNRSRLADRRRRQLLRDARVVNYLTGRDDSPRVELVPAAGN